MHFKAKQAPPTSSVCRFLLLVLILFNAQNKFWQKYVDKKSLDFFMSLKCQITCAEHSKFLLHSCTLLHCSNDFISDFQDLTLSRQTLCRCMSFRMSENCVETKICTFFLQCTSLKATSPHLQYKQKLVFHLVPSLNLDVLEIQAWLLDCFLCFQLWSFGWFFVDQFFAVQFFWYLSFAFYMCIFCAYFWVFFFRNMCCYLQYLRC